MAKFGVPTEAHMAKINKHSRRALSQDEVFVYPHKMAGDMIIPTRYIQLTPPLLEDFVKDANAGVSFLLNHSWTWSSPKAALSYGRVFEGELSKEGIVKGETVSFNGTTYIVRGQEKDGISTDAIISDIETGVMIDTSIGWGADKFICSICGNDIRDWRKCEHIPGRKYIVNEETGESKLCWAMASPPGYLMEDSGVFDGAYPGAGTSLSAMAVDGFENENGIFTAFEDFKTIPLEARVIGAYSGRGGIITFAKKTDHKKVYPVGIPPNTSGDETDLTKMHDMYHEMYAKKELPDGWTMKDLTQKHTETVEKLIMQQEHYMLDALDGNLPGHLKFKSQRKESAKLDALIAEIFNKAGIDPAQIEKATEQGFVMKDGKQFSVVDVQAAQAAAAPITHYMTQEQVKEKFSKELSADEVLALAKDGEMLRKEVIEAAIAAGVRAQGNDFPADTWRNTFATMSIQAIRDIEKTFQKQAEAEIPVGRQTVPGSLGKEHRPEIPNEAYKA